MTQQSGMVSQVYRRQVLRYGSALLGSGVLMGIGGIPLAQAQGGILSMIKSKGKIVVATEAAYAPYEFVKDGKIVGYGPDILATVVKALGVKLEQLDTPFNGILPGLLAKKFDFVATALNLTEERSKKFAMTMPIMQGYEAILKRKADTSIKAFDDLAGKRIGIATGSAQEKTAKTMSDELMKSKGKGIQEIKGFTSIPDANLALANQQIDAVMDASDVLGYEAAQKPDVYEVLRNEKGKPTLTCWASRAEDKELRDFVNQQLQKLQSSGELTKLQQKWFGYTVTLPTTGYLPPGSI